MELIYAVGDTYPPIEATLRVAASRTAVNLTDSTVSLQVYNTSGDLIMESSVEIVDATAGQIKYSIESSLTSSKARYNARFEIDFLDGTTASVPNDGFFKILVKE